MQQNHNYNFLLTNLLDINNNDSTLNFSIDNEKFFDVFKISDSQTFNALCNNYEFSVEFGEYGHKNLISKIKYAQTKEEIIQLFSDFSIDLPVESQLRLERDFEKEKKQISIGLESRFQRSVTKWKKIVKKAQDMNIETNIWPLHLGFFFINVSTEKKEVFAPLFFKEINIEIKNSLIYLKSSSDIKVNTKLVTFLQQVGYSLDTSNYDFSSKTIREVFDYFSKQWNKFYMIPESIQSKIPFPEKIENNNNITIHSGLVLGFFNVSSGYLWNQMKRIIENDEIEDILASNFNKNVYRNKVEDVIFNKNFGLYKIQQTNFSQDYATVSSLYQDTIIWGPPGTGKSQTITNLIVNILARDRTALVVSQKRAALEVIRSRLKELSIFGIFILNDRNWKIEKFYEPLNEFINKIENFNSFEEEPYFNIMPREDKRYVSLAKEIKKMPDYQNVLDTYSTMSNVEITEEILNDLKQLDPFIKYKMQIPETDFQSIASWLYFQNKNKKAGFLTKMTNTFPKNIKDSAQIIANNPELLKIDIDNALKNINTVDFESLKLVDQFFKYQLKSKTIEINNPKTLAKMIIKRTIDKMSTFNEEEKRAYRNFALSVRAASMKPYKFFHVHKQMIKKLFSVIVTTPDTDLSMWNKDEFDFAILDESSQMFLEKGIPILYLAKRKILAGDNQQMRPTKWFSASYAVEEDEDFKNIESLLDYAIARGIFKVLLDKNYRSKKASLMTFSSKNFYKSKLDVIDDYLTDTQSSPIDVIQVNGYWDNSLNQKEADTALEVVNKNLHKYEKIILLVFNAKQQEYIFNKIYSEFPELEWALSREKLSLKNIENIQGDEADLVVISVVYDKNTSLTGTYVARSGGKNALNVAISRAKEKIIVIKSLNAEDIKITENSTEDIIVLKEWLKFLELNEQNKKNYLKDNSKDNWTQTINLDISPTLLSEIKHTVLHEILYKDNNLEIQGDYVIGTKTINIAILNKTTKKILLGIMVDDYSYAGDEKLYVQFLDNFMFLNAKNYPLMIVKELDWKINKKNILQKIKEIVLSNNIEEVPKALTEEITFINTQQINTKDEDNESFLENVLELHGDIDERSSMLQIEENVVFESNDNQFTNETFINNDDDNSDLENLFNYESNENSNTYNTALEDDTRLLEIINFDNTNELNILDIENLPNENLEEIKESTAEFSIEKEELPLEDDIHDDVFNDHNLNVENSLQEENINVAEDDSIINLFNDENNHYNEECVDEFCENTNKNEEESKTQENQDTLNFDKNSKDYNDFDDEFLES